MDAKMILVALCAILVLLCCIGAARQERKGRRWGDSIERRVGRVEAQVVSLREELERKDLQTNARINEIDRRIAMADAPVPTLFNDEEE